VKRFAAAMLLVTGIAAGCSDKKPATTPQAEITPVPVAPAAYVPTPAPAPVTTVTPPDATASTTVATAGGSYTVKKGDTLWKIAQAKYGDGRKWKQIIAANPGLTPEKLKAGQTITLP